MRIQPEYRSFKNRCTISSTYAFQAHQQRSQRRCCFSQNALLLFEVLPDAYRFVAGAPRCSAMERDPSPERQTACNSPSESTRFRQSRQSRLEHPGVSDGNWGCCWWRCQLSTASPLWFGEFKRNNYSHQYFKAARPAYTRFKNPVSGCISLGLVDGWNMAMAGLGWLS